MIIVGYNSELIQSFFCEYPVYKTVSNLAVARMACDDVLGIDMSVENIIEDQKKDLALLFGEQNKMIISASPKIFISKVEDLTFERINNSRVFTSNLISLMNKFINARLDKFLPAKIIIINSIFTDIWPKGNFLYLDHMQTLLNFEKTVNLELADYKIEIKNFKCGPINTVFQISENGFQHIIDKDESDFNQKKLNNKLKSFFDDNF